MKLLAITYKDMLRAFRSRSMLIFMFAVPLLVTGMFAVLFGSIVGGGDEGYNLPVTRVVVANLDQGRLPAGESLAASLPQGFALSKNAASIGEIVVQVLQSNELADIMQVTLAASPEQARSAVDQRQAGVAVILPVNFTAALYTPDESATVEIYQDPTLTIGPEVVRSVLTQMLDGFAGVKISIGAAISQWQETGGTIDPAQMSAIQGVMLQTALAQAGNTADALLDVSSPAKPAQSGDFVKTLISVMMGGMMIMYAYFTGASQAETILTEEDQGTLPRLFTTPTRQATVLGGKVLAGAATILVQVLILLAAGALIFRIDWGAPLPLALAVLGIVISATSFGIFGISFLKHSRQAGAVVGGVVTLTGLLGLISVFASTSPNAAALGNTISLWVPQGWALRLLTLSMDGAAPEKMIVPGLVLLAWTAVFFFVGLLRFQRRYR